MTARQVLEVRHKEILLGGEWGRCIGAMSRHGVVFFWGNSGNGKTSAVLSLCRELARFGRVLYVALEAACPSRMPSAVPGLPTAAAGSRC